MEFTKFDRVRTMMVKGGSPAIHSSFGDTVHDEDDYAWIDGEVDDLYIGRWVFDYGFINIKFQKADVRPLTKEEVDRMNQMHFGINNTYCGQFNIDYEGYSIPR